MSRNKLVLNNFVLEKKNRKGRKYVMPKSCKYKVVKHLKDDIKTFNREAAEDKSLIKSLKKDKPKEKEQKNERKEEHKEKMKKDPKAKHMDVKKTKMEKVIHEASEGKLHSGSKNGPIVTNPKQILAIAYSEAKKATKKKKSK